MAYEINEVVIIDDSRNISNAGIITATIAELTTLQVNGNSIGDILDEDTLVSNSADAVPTQQSVKAYVDTAVASLQADIDLNESDSDTAESGLDARLQVLEADPTTQTLLDAEATARINADNALDSRLNTLEADPTTATAVAAVQTDVDNNETAQGLVNDDFATLSGVSLGSTTLGTFSGSTISDNISVKAALQDLEIGVDNALGGGAAAASVEVVTRSTDAAHFLTFVTDNNGSGTQENLYTDAGIQFNPSSNVLTVGEMVISGNLTVNGSQTVIDTTTIQAQDKNITLGVSTTASDTSADGGGFTLQGTTDKTFVWLQATDSFTASEHVDLISGKEYFINNVSVLSSTTLGTGVTNSSLTSVGTLNGVNISGVATLSNLAVTQITNLNGDVTLGNDVFDTIIYNGRVTSDIVPGNANLFDLGDSTRRWAELHVTNRFVYGDLDVDGATTLDATTIAGDLNHGGGNIIGDGSTNISGINTVTASGKMYALSFTTTSDAALKENVAEIEDAVAKVEAIRGVTFDWKDGSGSTAGVIAQEVEAVLPSIIDEGEHKRVDYNGLIGLLVEAVKELSAEVKELKAK